MEPRDRARSLRLWVDYAVKSSVIEGFLGFLKSMQSLLGMPENCDNDQGVQEIEKQLKDRIAELDSVLMLFPKPQEDLEPVTAEKLTKWFELADCPLTHEFSDTAPWWFG